MSRTFTKSALTGGTAGTLDAVDADELSDGDRAIVITTTGIQYTFVLDADSAAAESSPDVIAPNEGGGVAYTGDKRWVRCQIDTLLPYVMCGSNSGSRGLNIKTFKLAITDASTASEIDAAVTSSGVGYDVGSASTTDLGKDESDSGFSLSAGGTELTLDGTTIFGGTVEGIISAWIERILTTSTLLPGFSFGVADLTVTIEKETETNGTDLTALVDESTGTVNVYGCVLVLEA